MSFGHDAVMIGKVDQERVPLGERKPNLFHVVIEDLPVPSRCALGGEYTDRKDALHIESHGAEAEGLKEQIDELHKRKIDLCDEVFVLNIGDYIGESTRSEIDYAVAQGKPVVYLEPRDSRI